MKGKKTGGRVAGTPNKLTLDLKAALMPSVQATIKELVRLAKSAENEAVRLKAIEIVHERVYGKVSQVLAGDSENPIMFSLEDAELVRGLAFILTKQAKG